MQLRTHLEDNPVTFLGGQIHVLLRNDLLTLAQRHIVEVVVVEGESQLLTQGFHILQGIHTGRQDEEDGCGRVGLLVRLGKLHLPTLHVLGAQFLLNKVPAR